MALGVFSVALVKHQISLGVESLPSTTGASEIWYILAYFLEWTVQLAEMDDS